MLRRFIIERDIPGVGAMTGTQLGETARISNGALGKLSGIQWQHSYVAGGKTFCVYLADSETVIREHAQLTGIPANRITEVNTVIDPTTEQKCAITNAT